MKNRLSSSSKQQGINFDDYDTYRNMIHKEFDIVLPESKENFTLYIYMERLGSLILEENGSQKGKRVSQGKIFMKTIEQTQENIIEIITGRVDEQLQDTNNISIYIDEEEYNDIQLFIKKLRRNGENIQYDFPYIADILEKYMNEEQKKLLQQYYHKENLSLQKIMMGLQGPKAREKIIYQYIHSLQAKK